jgi:hypothetical protein
MNTNPEETVPAVQKEKPAAKEENPVPSVIYPGTVFTARNYDPFTKKVLSHPFLCVYDQVLDQDVQGETNVLALLITSNNKQYSRQVPVSKTKNPYLDKDSFCYCNNIYMFLKKDCKIIGQLDSDTFFEIVKKRQQILRSEDDQCVQALMNMKAHESKVKLRAYTDKQITSLSNELTQTKGELEEKKRKEEENRRKAQEQAKARRKQVKTPGGNSVPAPEKGAKPSDKNPDAPENPAAKKKRFRFFNRQKKEEKK